jgi:hypothetical protein
MFDGIHPVCKCGCGGEVEILINGRNCDLGKETYCRDYIKGHWDWSIESNEQKTLIEYIESIYKGKIETNTRKYISPNEIDIFLPELNIGIEYNGLYWHSEKAGKDRNYHIDKTLQVKKQNIFLIHIFSDEWNNKQDIVKSKLKNLLKLETNKIYARKCEIKKISVKTKNSFLEKYHLQGPDRSQIHLGLYYNDELSAVMTFAKPRKGIGKSNTIYKQPYELSRYASSINIIGGASKLLKHFINNYNPDYIYSYSDNRWSNWDNNMYGKMGFTLSHLSPPSYYYTKDFNTKYHRFNFNKTRLKKMGYDISKTESDIMKEIGYTKIWDCGNAKFEMII